jgi:hypothetical protein
VAQHFSPTAATIEADGPDSCVVTTGADDPERLALYLAMADCDFEIIGPPEVIAGAVDGRTTASRGASVVATTGFPSCLPNQRQTERGARICR